MGWDGAARAWRGEVEVEVEVDRGGFWGMVGNVEYMCQYMARECDASNEIE